MYISKSMVVKFLVIAGIVLSAWSIWKRLDAVFENYQKYYDIALGQKIINDLVGDSDKQFDREWAKFGEAMNEKRSNISKDLEYFSRDYDKNLRKAKKEGFEDIGNLSMNTESKKEHRQLIGTMDSPHITSSAEKPYIDPKKYNDYSEKSLIKPVPNAPTPYIADEYTMGYYGGLWNFFVRNGFLRIFGFVIVSAITLLLIRLVIRKVDEKIKESEIAA